MLPERTPRSIHAFSKLKSPRKPHALSKERCGLYADSDQGKEAFGNTQLTLNTAVNCDKMNITPFERMEKPFFHRKTGFRKSFEAGLI